MTLTHEVTHIIIRGIQSRLHPDYNNEAEVDASFGLLAPDAAPQCVLDEIRRLYLYTLVGMNNASTGKEPGDDIDIDVPLFKKILRYWRADADE